MDQPKKEWTEEERHKLALDLLTERGDFDPLGSDWPNGDAAMEYDFFSPKIINTDWGA